VFIILSAIDPYDFKVRSLEKDKDCSDKNEKRPPGAFSLLLSKPQRLGMERTILVPDCHLSGFKIRMNNFA